MNRDRLVLLLMLLFAFSLFADDVPMFRGNPEHTGVIADSAMPKSVYGTYRWRFHTGGKI